MQNLLSVDDNTTVAGGVDPLNAINNFVAQKNPSEIDVAVGSGASLDSSGAAISYDDQFANTILIGRQDDGILTAGDGNNLVLGGRTITVGDGKNLVVTSAANANITLGGGDNIVVLTGAGDTINVETLPIRLTQTPTRASAFGHDGYRHPPA